MVSHCKETVALIAVLIADHSLLFYICVATVIEGAGGHGVVVKGWAAHCMHV